MHYKTNRLNHDFQIAYFIAGSCQTPDAAYAILCDLKADRELALKNAEAGALRSRAKFVRAIEATNSTDEATRLEGEADLLEINAFADTVKANIDAAVAELATINKCIEVIQPLRKYAFLPDALAHEAAQAEEWKLQLIVTAENQLVSQGCIAHDHFATMRMHPAFASEIMPALDKTRALMQAHRNSDKYSEVMTKHLQRDQQQFKALLTETVPKLTHENASNVTKDLFAEARLAE